MTVELCSKGVIRYIEKSSRRVTVIKQYRKFSGLIEGSAAEVEEGRSRFEEHAVGFLDMLSEWLESAKLKFLAATRV